MRVSARRVDDNEVVFFGQRFNGHEELDGFRFFIAIGNWNMVRDRLVGTAAQNVMETVCQITGEAALAGIEIHGADGIAQAHQSDGCVHGGCGFAASALLVAKDNDMAQSVVIRGRHLRKNDSLDNEWSQKLKQITRG